MLTQPVYGVNRKQAFKAVFHRSISVKLITCTSYLRNNIAQKKSKTHKKTQKVDLFRFDP